MDYNFFQFEKTDLVAKRLALSARNTLSKNCVITCKMWAPDRKYFSALEMVPMTVLGTRDQ